MSNYDSLLAGLVDNPTDYGRRRVFAEWLMENGDPDRGEFIDLSLLLDGLHEGSLDADGNEYGFHPLHEAHLLDEPERTLFPRNLARVAELFAAHATDWFGRRVEGLLVDYRLHDLLGIDTPSLYSEFHDVVLEVRRGFIERVWVAEESTWTEIGPRLVAEHPIDDLEVGRFDDETDEGGWGLGRHIDEAQRTERAADLLNWAYEEAGFEVETETETETETEE